MSIKPKGYVDLVHADKGAGFALMKGDSWALGIIIEGLRNSIQKYEVLTDQGDLDKLAKIKEITDQIVYIRESCINE
jgi:hypothetical protein